MADVNPTSTPPAAPTPPAPQPPAAPGPYATRAEWRAWRRDTRAYFRSTGLFHSYGIWSWFWAIALILVGAYYFMANLGLFNWVRGDLIWPALLIVLGVMVLISRARTVS